MDNDANYIPTRCDHCRFFELDMPTNAVNDGPISLGKNTGFCVRHAPRAVCKTVFADNPHAMFPIVRCNQWCGEFAPIQESEE